MEVKDVQACSSAQMLEELIQGSDLMRQFVRHPSNIPVNISLDSVDFEPEGKPEHKSHHEKETNLQNLSQGGLCCDVAERIDIGSLITIKIPVVNPSYAGHGVVVWCRETGDHYEVGIRFAGAQEAFETRMVEQICQIEQYKNEVLQAEGRIIDGEQAAKEWISKYAEDFSKNLK